VAVLIIFLLVNAKCDEVSCQFNSLP